MSVIGEIEIIRESYLGHPTYYCNRVKQSQMIFRGFRIVGTTGERYMSIFAAFLFAVCFDIGVYAPASGTYILNLM